MAHDILHAGEAENFKGGLHLTMFGLAVTFTLYNAGAYIVRPTRLLGFNTLVYLALMALEAKQTQRHFSSHATHER